MVQRRTQAARLAALGFALAGATAVSAQETTTPLADDPTLVALAVALSCAPAPDAPPAPAPGAAPGAAPDPAGPELELVATVRAKELSFDDVPQLGAGLARRPLRHTTWKTERVNLPVRPEAGVAYHDVAVRLTVTSTIDELAHLLAQAKRASRGVKMKVDDAAPAPAAAPSTAAAAPKKR